MAIQSAEEWAAAYFDVALYVDQQTKFQRLVALITARDAAIRAEEREALRKYGRHGSDCNLYQSFDKDPGHCRCGLSQALRTADGDTERCAVQPGTATNPAIEAVRNAICERVTCEGRPSCQLCTKAAAPATAALLDNLPRAEMAQGMFNWPTTDKGWSGINEEARAYWLGKIDAATAAARATLLPSAAT